MSKLYILDFWVVFCAVYHVGGRLELTVRLPPTLSPHAQALPSTLWLRNSNKTCA